MQLAFNSPSKNWPIFVTLLCNIIEQIALCTQSALKVHPVQWTPTVFEYYRWDDMAVKAMLFSLQTFDVTRGREQVCCWYQIKKIRPNSPERTGFWHPLHNNKWSTRPVWTTIKQRQRITTASAEHFGHIGWLQQHNHESRETWRLWTNTRHQWFQNLHQEEIIRLKSKLIFFSV